MPSAYKVPMASDVLPEPDTPLMAPGNAPGGKSSRAVIVKTYAGRRRRAPSGAPRARGQAGNHRNPVRTVHPRGDNRGLSARPVRLGLEPRSRVRSYSGGRGVMGNDLGGSFALGPWRVRRAGYGAMQLAGDGVFGPSRDRDEALRVLRAAVEAGMDHIDTAQYYGAGTVNELIRAALHPYPEDLAIVSKVAAGREGDGALVRFGEPHELRQGIGDNLAT